MKTLGVYVISYKRYDKIMTQSLVEDCTYVVRESEAELYKKAGVNKILAVPDEQINSFMKVYDYVTTQTPEDIVCILDDDFKDIIYRMDENKSIDDPEIVQAEIERIAQLMEDLKIGYACTDATPRPFGYDAEFGFKGISGGMRWINKQYYKAKLDPKVEHNCDVDVVLQELLKNRIILKPKYLCDVATLDVNEGGANDTKTRKHQLESIEAMKNKWGVCFEYDFKKNVPKINVKR